MLKGYRCYFIVFSGLILAAAEQPQKERPTDSAQQQTPQTAKPTATKPETSQPPYRTYAERYSDACYNDKNHDTADLCAQWRAAIAAEKAAGEARKATIAAFIGLLLSGAGLVALVRTILQGREMLKIAQSALEHDVRPMLVAKDITAVVGNGLVAQIVVENIGAGPAQIVDAEAIVRRKLRESFEGERPHPIPEAKNKIFFDEQPLLVSGSKKDGTFIICAIRHLRENQTTFQVTIRYRHALRAETSYTTEFNGTVHGGTKAAMPRIMDSGMSVETYGFASAGDDEIVTAWIEIDRDSWKFT